MDKIKFRSAHYNYDGTFNGFSYWGAIDRFGNIETTSKGFASPTSRSGTERKFEERFLGLKDKNGTEIFEGDIYKTEFGAHYWIFVVKTVESLGGSNNLYGVLVEDNLSDDEFGENYTFEKRTFQKGRYESVMSSKSVIIGNIHENPELCSQS